jgi:predicted RNA binding protein YcfA (HicA-like mRNA interferase family)
MPRKIRDLKASLRKAGFDFRPGKGSHTVWRHPLLPQIKLTIAGHDGDDAQPYQIHDVEDALRHLKEVKSEQEY